MRLKRIYATVIILILILQMVSGIEVDFSVNELDLSTKSDVDDQVYFYEEVSGDPQQTTISDYREVSGNGKINLKQGFSSNSYTATSGVKADSGSVQSSALLTSTDLSATQRSNIAGSFSQSFLAGWQDYYGGMALTGQYLGVENGILSTVQTLSLGRSIYSAQAFQASGIHPLAIGYALVGSHGSNFIDAQGAFIVAGACNEGSFSGFMGAEVIKVPDAIDPVAYGSHITAQGDKAAGVIAGAGALKGSWSESQFADFIGLDGQGAFTGTVGVGEDSRASVRYIQAQTDGQETSAYQVNAKAKGDDAAIVTAGAGDFNLQSADGFGPIGPFGGPQFGPMMAFYRDRLDLQGALIVAAGIGDNNKAKASYIGAITDGSRTLAAGDRLKANSNGLALVGAAAGSIGYDASGYYYRSRHNRLMEEFGYLGVQGALATALGLGCHSSASADIIAAGTNGQQTFAFAADPKARGGSLATAFAAAGNLQTSSYEYKRDSCREDTYSRGYYLGVQGALADAFALGGRSSASADLMAAGTNWDKTYAFATDATARGKDLATVLAASGNLNARSFQSERNERHDDTYKAQTTIDAQAALAGAMGIGGHSSASACVLKAETNGESTDAFALHANARGCDLATVLAAAGSLYWNSYLAGSDRRHGYAYKYTNDLGIQGALAGALGFGGRSSASTDIMAAGTNGDKTYAFATDAAARGNGLATVLAASGNLNARSLQSERNERHDDTYKARTAIDAQAALAGAMGIGGHSSASACVLKAETNGESTDAFALHANARGSDLATALAAAGSLYWNSYLAGRDRHHGNTYIDVRDLGIQGALAGALGFGGRSSASTDIMAAGTNGEKTYAFATDARARGNGLATVLAGAGNLQAGITRWGSNGHHGYYDSNILTNFVAQGALAGAMGIGGHSSASACVLKAETNEDSTEALAAHGRAQGSDLATVMAGAGTLYWNNLVQESNSKKGYSYVNMGNFGGHAALAGAMSIGDCSHASADLVRAGTSDQHSFALAVDPRARGNGLATVLGAAGALISAYDSTDNSGYLGAQGAFVGALGLGGHASTSAHFVGAGTYGYSQSAAYACDLRAKGSSLAAVAGGAGAVEFEQSPIINNFDYQGSAVGAYSVGLNSKAFARYIRADTTWDESSAFARHIGSGPTGHVFAGVAHPLIGGVNGITVPAGYYSQAMAGVTSNPTTLYWGIIP